MCLICVMLPLPGGVLVPPPLPFPFPPPLLLAGVELVPQALRSAAKAIAKQSLSVLISPVAK